MKASFPTAAADDDSRESDAVSSAIELISITSGPKNSIRALKKKNWTKKQTQLVST